MLLSVLKTCGWSDADDYRILVITLYNLVIFVPLIIPKNLTVLRIVSSLSLIASLYIALVVMVETPKYLSNGEDVNIPMFNYSVDLVDALALIIFALDSSRSIPIIFEELKPRKFNRMYYVMIMNILIVGFMYGIIAICGLVSQGEDTARLVVERTAYDGDSP